MKSKIDPKSDVADILKISPNPFLGRRLKRYTILALVILLAAAAWAFLRTTGPSTQLRYKTEPVQQGDLQVIVTATGTLQPMKKVDVGSELSGIIKSVEVDYNHRVKVGQVLARLDTSKLEAQLTQSRAALESAKAKVLQAQATLTETRAKLAQFQKVRDLSQDKVPSHSEMDAAEGAFERAKADTASARAAVSQAQATLQANETDLAKSVIRSPVNGLVLTRGVEPGQTVAASFTTPVLFTLAEDLTQMDLHVNVDEADVGKIREGQEASFSVAAYSNRTFRGRITQVRFGSSTTSGVVTYETVLKVDNRDLALRPGMTATADILIKKIEKAVLVPSSALRFTPPAQPVKEKSKPSVGLIGALLPRPPGPQANERENTAADKKQQRVWILENGSPSAVPVTIGMTDGNRTEIIAGALKPGMMVVVDTADGGK